MNGIHNEFIYMTSIQLILFVIQTLLQSTAVIMTLDVKIFMVNVVLSQGITFLY